MGPGNLFLGLLVAILIVLVLILFGVGVTPGPTW